MDLRELRSFVTIVHAGSFSRAAEELHIAQPALSRQIAKLEAELGVALLVRHGRGAALTKAGARLLDRAELMLQNAAETIDHVRDENSAERGYLAIGLTPAIGQMIGPQLIARFRALWPNALLHVREGLSTSLQAWLLDGSVQVAIAYNQPLLEAFEVQPLFTEPMMLVGPPDEQRETVRLRDLEHLPLILPALPHSNRRLIQQAALQNGVRLDVVLEADSVMLTKELVRRGDGYSIIAHAAVWRDVESGRLSGWPIERPALRSSVSIARLHDQRETPLMRSWIELQTDELRKLVKEGEWRSMATWIDHGSVKD
ncbi:LysR family transcriptional regulator [Sphingomonas montana]|uniref:LysR family transcriptional regulator n=1 Tax=Sphingomonas montana TaxID=1843236 RepID=UPI00096DC611|nr:LysR family transcriptional regulator [Sphingomonas montana]